MNTDATMRMPAEWEPQSGVQLTWPHADTDWQPYLPEAEACFVRIACEIVKREPLLIVSPNPNQVRTQLAAAGLLPLAEGRSIDFFECPTNDTWARDHAFISLIDSTGTHLLNDFCFNGWGLKFAADKDNQINSALFGSGLLGTARYINCQRWVLEGGSVESNGCGTLLTTTSCLLAPNRNGFSTKAEAEAMLTEKLGARRVLWLDHGYLAGDDTDGHIDTLARLCPDDTIAYVHCTDPSDEHFAELQAMESELKMFRTASGKPYRLLPLPMPRPVCEGAERLPATYANFLIMNKAVLMPTYGQPDKDAEALQILRKAFPEREVVGVDCQVLVKQHGSLHCVTMQYPLTNAE